MERKFLVDFMLGRLCRWLRLLGENASYYRGDDKGGIIYKALKERRIILTRDRRLSRKKALKLYLVESEDFREQLKEVIKEFGIDVNEDRIFTICLECGTTLSPINKCRIKEKVPEYVFNTQEEFSICSECQKIFWKGTHRELIKRVLGKIKE